MEIKQLKVFVTVAEHMSFSKASQDLGLSQSSISKYIKQLEEEMDAELFARTKKQIALTPAGVVFLAEAEQILKITNDPFEFEENITVGFLPLSMVTFLPELISHIKETLPELKIHFKNYQDNTKIVSDLKEGVIDVAFFNETYTPQGVEVMMVQEDEIVAFQSLDSPFAKLEEISEQDLPHLKYILPPREANPWMLDLFFNYCKMLGFEPEVEYFINPHQMRLALASANLGVALDCISLARLDIANLTYTRMEEKIRTYTRIVMGWIPKPTKMKTIHLFKDYFEEQAANKQTIL
ncbi:MAG TPA: hypothetical protein DCS93_34685 [Microscillaceae bacterium]|nr:hypothetical protein [Microscillaceae bacterium]